MTVFKCMILCVGKCLDFVCCLPFPWFTASSTKSTRKLNSCYVLLHLTKSQDHIFDRWVCNTYPRQHSFTQLHLEEKQKKKNTERKTKMEGMELKEEEGGREGRMELNVEIWITNPSSTIWTEKTHIIVESRHIELDLLRDPSAPREINLIPWFD